MKNTKSGFTTIELLVSMGIFSVILAVLAWVTTTTLKTWRASTDEQLQFRNSKIAFDAIFNRLSTAELNPYWGYEFGNGSTQSPTSYKKQSDLHFVCGPATGAGSSPALIPGDVRLGHAVFFHGAFGLSEEVAADRLGLLLNSWGFFLEFGPDEGRADFITTEANLPERNRFRLMELQVKSEELTTFQNRTGDISVMDLNEADDTTSLYSWFRDPIANGDAHLLAENIVALVIAPLPPIDDDLTYDESALAPDFFYDTRAAQHTTLSGDLLEQSNHQLPPVVRVTMVAISEGSAIQLEDEFGSSQPILGIEQLFQDARSFEDDIEALRTVLIARDIEFQVFSDTVKLRNSKWTEQ